MNNGTQIKHRMSFEIDVFGIITYFACVRVCARVCVCVCVRACVCARVCIALTSIASI